MDQGLATVNFNRLRYIYKFLNMNNSNSRVILKAKPKKHTMAEKV